MDRPVPHHKGGVGKVWSAHLLVEHVDEEERHALRKKGQGDNNFRQTESERDTCTWVPRLDTDETLDAIYSMKLFFSEIQFLPCCSLNPTSIHVYKLQDQILNLI